MCTCNKHLSIINEATSLIAKEACDHNSGVGQAAAVTIDKVFQAMKFQHQASGLV